MKEGTKYYPLFRHLQASDQDEIVLTRSDQRQYLPADTYQYTSYLQMPIPGEFQVMPTMARQEFFPEVNGRSDGLVFTVE